MSRNRDNTGQNSPIPADLDDLSDEDVLADLGQLLTEALTFCAVAPAENAGEGAGTVAEMTPPPSKKLM